MQDRTMSSALKLHIYFFSGNYLGVWGKKGIYSQFQLFILADGLGDISALPDCRGCSCRCIRTRDETVIKTPVQ